MMLFDSRHDAIDLRSTRSPSPRRTSTENRRELRWNRGVELRLEATERERLEPFELRIAPNRSPWPRRISIEHRRELRWNRGVELHLEAIDRERLEPFELRIAPNRSPWPRRTPPRNDPFESRFALSFAPRRSTWPRRTSTENRRELRWNRGVELRPQGMHSIEPPANAAAKRSVRVALRVELRPESLAMIASGIDPLNEAAIVFAETIQVQTNNDVV